MSRLPYETPEVELLGTVEELTRMPVNKIGPNPDALVSPAIVVGSVVQLP